MTVYDVRVAAPYHSEKLIKCVKIPFQSKSLFVLKKNIYEIKLRPLTLKLACTCKKNYVTLQHNYFYMRTDYVCMQHNGVDISLCQHAR